MLSHQPLRIPSVSWSNPALSGTYFSVDDLEFIDGWADVYLPEYGVRIDCSLDDCPETAVVRRRGGGTYRVNVTRGGQVMLSSGPTGRIVLGTVEEALGRILDLDDLSDAAAQG